MRGIINGIVAASIAGALGAVALGLLIAAAVEAFTPLVGSAGALGIVGGFLLVVAVVVFAIMQARRPRRAETVQQRGVDLGGTLGGTVAGFLLGLWDGFTRPRRDRDS